MSVRVRSVVKVDTSIFPPEVKTIELPLPPSANSYWRPLVIKGRACMGVTNEARKYKADVKRLCEEGLWNHHPHPTTSKLFVSIRAYTENMRGDVTNLPKVLLDAIEGRVLVNDRQVLKMHVEHCGIDKENPRVVVEISVLEN